ncbi:hypothetical protein WDV91_05965 [Curtobacterium flaccumfaciens pv. flaccumfaciens]
MSTSWIQCPWMAPSTGPASVFVMSEMTRPPTTMTVIRVRWRSGPPMMPMNIATM